MYVDLGFHVYSLSEGAAKAFQLLFTVLNKKRERINHIQARKNSIQIQNIQRRSTKATLILSRNTKWFLVPLSC